MRVLISGDGKLPTPLISATTLASAIGMSIKCATELLHDFLAAEIAVEVTHRSARRLFGLAGMAPLRDATAAPRRPLPERRTWTTATGATVGREASDARAAADDGTV